jgi:hypothetical protein
MFFLLIALLGGLAYDARCGPPEVYNATVYYRYLELDPHQIRAPKHYFLLKAGTHMTTKQVTETEFFSLPETVLVRARLSRFTGMFYIERILGPSLRSDLSTGPPIESG